MTATDDAPGGMPCRICGARTTRLGDVHGSYSQRDYELRRCEDCRYAFIADPWTEFTKIYDDRYYAGQGADPLVDYGFELSHPDRTIRRYEWRGITRTVQQLLGGLQGTRWLDFGSGNGGLVRYVQEHTSATACGFEEGSIAGRAREFGIPVRTTAQLEDERSSFDVVTAIEVLEHTIDPLAELHRIRRMLRPGGLLLLTTGNAAAFASKLLSWPYVIPEIHVSFFEPGTLARAFALSGFRPAPMPARDGFEEILKYKVLKNLKVRRRTVMTDLIPARPLAVLADRRTQLSRHPVGWAS